MHYQVLPGFKLNQTKKSHQLKCFVSLFSNLKIVHYKRISDEYSFFFDHLLDQ